MTSDIFLVYHLFTEPVFCYRISSTSFSSRNGICHQSRACVFRPENVIKVPNFTQGESTYIYAHGMAKRHSMPIRVNKCYVVMLLCCFFIPSICKRRCLSQVQSPQKESTHFCRADTTKNLGHFPQQSAYRISLPLARPMI